MPLFSRLFHTLTAAFLLVAWPLAAMAAGSFDDASITDIRVLGNTTIAGDDIISWL
ncbi:MAG: hypothetical protein HGA76_10450, partial [Candidatus Firestonebacteria bacterium]|nr:hypothetical protein [Candidatus Firestonebacteria bacterium]